ncbi:unnamed protein product [Spirodela intermedia]|uniref:Uncharacterized protein n=1 Tax=Spirodela intermedia TaxID=51605 RepID=A0A7I8K639_SPIIN|nr:unnamed protein product [Spirodela intermedia]
MPTSIPPPPPPPPPPPAARRRWWCFYSGPLPPPPRRDYARNPTAIKGTHYSPPASEGKKTIFSAL